MLFIEIETPGGLNKTEASPMVTYESSPNLIDFPFNDFNEVTSPIYHTIELVSSLELLNGEFKITEEIENAIEREILHK